MTNPVGTKTGVSYSLETSYREEYSKLSGRQKSSIERGLMAIAAKRIEHRIGNVERNKAVIDHLKICFMLGCTVDGEVRIPKVTDRIPQIINIGETIQAQIRTEISTFLSELKKIAVELGNLNKSSEFGEFPLVQLANEASEPKLSNPTYEKLKAYCAITTTFIFNVTKSALDQLGEIVPDSTKEKISSNLSLSSRYFRSICFSFIAKSFGLNIDPISITDNSIIRLSNLFSESNRDLSEIISENTDKMFDLFLPYFKPGESFYIKELIWRYMRDIVHTVDGAGNFLQNRAETMSPLEYQTTRERILGDLSLSIPIIDSQIIINSKNSDLIESALFHIWEGGINVEGIGMIPSVSAIQRCIRVIQRTAQDTQGVVERLKYLATLTNRFTSLSTYLDKNGLRQLSETTLDAEALKLEEEYVRLLNLKTESYITLQLNEGQESLFGGLRFLETGIDYRGFMALQGIGLEEGTLLTRDVYVKLDRETKQRIWRRLLVGDRYKLPNPSYQSASLGDRFRFLFYDRGLDIFDYSSLFKSQGFNDPDKLKQFDENISSLLSIVSTDEFLRKALQSTYGATYFQKKNITLEKAKNRRRASHRKLYDLNREAERLAKLVESEDPLVSKEVKAKLSQISEARERVNNKIKFQEEEILGIIRDSYPLRVAEITALVKDLRVILTFEKGNVSEALKRSFPQTVYKQTLVASEKEIDLDLLEKTFGIPVDKDFREAFGSIPYYPIEKMKGYLLDIAEQIKKLNIRLSYNSYKYRKINESEENRVIIKNILSLPIFKYLGLMPDLYTFGLKISELFGFSFMEEEKTRILLEYRLRSTALRDRYEATQLKLGNFTRQWKEKRHTVQRKAKYKRTLESLEQLGGILKI